MDATRSRSRFQDAAGRVAATIIATTTDGNIQSLRAHQPNHLERVARPRRR